MTMQSTDKMQWSTDLILVTVIPVSLLALLLLFYIIFSTFCRRYTCLCGNDMAISLHPYRSICCCTVVGVGMIGVDDVLLMANAVPPRYVDPQTCCMICLEDIHVKDDDLVELACCHKFHRDCIKNWLTRSNSCPLCKRSVKVTVIENSACNQSDRYSYGSIENGHLYFNI